MDREEYMALALCLAKEAADMGEVPVGCVVVSNGQVIARSHNETEADHDPTAHAEMLAIRRAADTGETSSNRRRRVW